MYRRINAFVLFFKNFIFGELDKNEIPTIFENTNVFVGTYIRLCLRVTAIFDKKNKKWKGVKN